MSFFGALKAILQPNKRVGKAMAKRAGFVSFFNELLGGMERYYKVARQSRLAVNWDSGLSHIHTITQQSHRTVVARTRQQFANNGYVRRIFQQMEQNVIGENGIVLQSKHPVEAVKNLIELVWAEWGELATCEVTGQYSWVDIQVAVQRSIDMNGEAFLLKVANSTINQYGFALQLIDPQRIPSGLLLEKNENGNRVINGVEVNAYDKPVAYYLTRQDDSINAYNQHSGKQSYERIPADQCIHIFEPDYIGAKRGFPRVASVLGSLYQIGEFEEAAVTNARFGAGSNLVVHTTDDYVAPAPPEHYQVDDKGNPVEPDAGASNVPLPMLEPGVAVQLAPGYKATQYDPTYPNNEFGPFRKALLQTVAVGVGCSYANLASDGQAINFSTMRSFSLEERDGYLLKQQKLITHLCKPVFECFLKEVLKNSLLRLNGKVFKLADFNDLKAVRWQGRRWQWIDPLKDTMAKTQAIKNMTTSISQVIREQGNDPEEVLQEIANDLSVFLKAGIPASLLGNTYGFDKSDNELIKQLLKEPPPNA